MRCTMASCGLCGMCSDWWDDDEREDEPRDPEPPEDDPRFSDEADEALFVEEFERRGLTQVQPDLLAFAS
jgi:hypothetical protein